MRCSKCGMCCERTEMPLSEEDLTRLEETGYCREEFAVSNKFGLVKLRNVSGWCYFYNPTMKRCKVYAIRPLGCYLYPIIYSDEEGITAPPKNVAD